MTRKIKKTKGEEEKTSDSDSETGLSDAAWEEIPLRDVPAKQSQAAGEECESDSTTEAGVEFHPGTVSFVKKKKQEEEQKTRQGFRAEDSSSVGRESRLGRQEHLEGGGVIQSRNPGQAFRPDETRDSEGGRGRQLVDREILEDSSEEAGSFDIKEDSRIVETPGGVTATPTTTSQPPTESQEKGWTCCPKGGRRRWWRISQCRKRIGEAPGFFAIGTIVWIVVLLVAINVSGDVVDIPFAILVLLLVRTAVTVSFERPRDIEEVAGGRYEVLDLTPSGLTRHFYHPPVFDCSLCCCMHVSVEPVVVRQSTLVRPKAETDFSHEVADIFEMSPTDCPQMKTLETKDFLDNEISTSPECVPEPTRTVAADVHASGSDAEPDGVRCEHYGHGVACGCAALERKPGGRDVPARVGPVDGLSVSFGDRKGDVRSSESSRKENFGVAEYVCPPAEFREDASPEDEEVSLDRYFKTSAGSSPKDSAEMSPQPSTDDILAGEHFGEGAEMSEKPNP